MEHLKVVVGGIYLSIDRFEIEDATQEPEKKSPRTTAKWNNSAIQLDVKMSVLGCTGRPLEQFGG